PHGALCGGRLWRLRCLRRRWPLVQQLQKLQSAATVVVQKAKVSRPLKPFEQDMLQQQPQEVRAVQCAGGGFVALGIPMSA
ncbi:MAG: hypothetical protein WEK74_10390, partial [Hydrogenophaga sp.]